MNLPKDKNLQLLAETFDLDMPEYYLVVTDYAFEAGAIRINIIKLFDSKGVFLKIVDNKKVAGHMSKYPVSFGN